MKIVLYIWVVALHLISLMSLGYAQPPIALSMHGDVKHTTDRPFPYVNAQAPKGGTLRLGAVGAYNTFNPFTLKGEAPEGLALMSERLVFESLMVRSLDEPFTLYGLIAQSIEVGPNREWIIFHLNPQACWSDGVAVTADDVLFSYQVLLTEGKPVYQLHYSQVEKAEKLSPKAVKFTFKATEGQVNQEIPLIMGLMPVLPSHALKGKDFSTVDFQTIPGTGPYKIHEAALGKTITYKRRLDYWAKDLLIRQGFYNFDTIKIIYFFQNHLVFEAFKAGQIDYIPETNTIAWQRNYDFPLLHQGKAKKIAYEHAIVQGMKGLVLNTRRPLFTDRRVRQALALVFSYDTLNKNLYGGSYQPYRSFFDNSELAGYQAKLEDEKKLLTGVPRSTYDALQKDEKERLHYQSLTPRQRLMAAKELFQQAGWELQKGRLVHTVTQKPFTFELCIYNQDTQKMALYLQQDLKKIGIQLVIRLMDTAQYEKRLQQYDFDSIIHFWGQSLSPGNEQKHYWSTHAALTPGSRNHAGIQESEIDHCCEAIAQAKDRPTLKAWVHLLDLLLLRGAYVIPLGYNKHIYAVHSHQLGHPDLQKEVGIFLSMWWHKGE